MSEKNRKRKKRVGYAQVSLVEGNRDDSLLDFCSLCTVENKVIS